LIYVSTFLPQPVQTTKKHQVSDMTIPLDIQGLHQNLTVELNTLASLVKQQASQCTHPAEQKLALELSSHPVFRWPDLNTSSLPAAIRLSFQRIENILATLSQIELNMYGLCADCEQQIETDRLTRDPTTQRCNKCAEKQLSGH
jgi:DnaK suppressor protein